MHFTSRCGGTVYALVSKTSPREGLRVRISPPSLPIHMCPPTSVLSSNSLFFVYRSPPKSAVVCRFCCHFCCQGRPRRCSLQAHLAPQYIPYPLIAAPHVQTDLAGAP